VSERKLHIYVGPRPATLELTGNFDQIRAEFHNINKIHKINAKMC